MSERAPENSGDNSGDARSYLRVRVKGGSITGEAHLALDGGTHTLCGYYRRPPDDWDRVFGPITVEEARSSESVCLTCRAQVPKALARV